MNGSNIEKEAILRVDKVSYSYELGRKVRIPALRDVSLDVHRGEIFSLVGESGSGKSTLAKCIMNIIRPDKGRIFYDDIEIGRENGILEKKRLQQEIQFIFQDSSTSLNPRMTVEKIIEEPLKLNKRYSASHMQKHVESVRLDESYYPKYPYELSGGQRQRVSIARAVAMEPKLLIADEPVAALDVSIQAQIMNLFLHLQKEHGFSFLLISHDLAMMRFISNRIGIMYQGHLVESGPTKEVFERPAHPYTKALLSSIPVPDPIVERRRKASVMPKIKFEMDTEMEEVGAGHYVIRENHI